MAACCKKITSRIFFKKAFEIELIRRWPLVARKSHRETLRQQLLPGIPNNDAKIPPGNCRSKNKGLKVNSTTTNPERQNTN